MVTKEGKPIFFQAVSIAVIVLIINVAYLMYKSGGLSKGLTGFSVKANITESFFSLSSFGQVFFIIEISMVFLILLIAFVRDVSLNKSKAQIIELHINKNSGENKTDLDTLYETLKEKKELNISTIAKAFEVDKEIVMEWAKILESANLATIEYPGFSEPIVKYNNKDIKTIEIKKTDVIKDSSKIKKEIEGSNKGKKERNKNIKEKLELIEKTLKELKNKR